MNCESLYFGELRQSSRSDKKIFLRKRTNVPDKSEILDSCFLFANYMTVLSDDCFLSMPLM